MLFFQLLASVLDEVWAQLPGTTEDEKTVAVEAMQGNLQKHYAQLSNTSTPIDYRDPATRYAYLRCYVASHAHLVAYLIGKDSSLGALFTNDRVQVTCVGGGPGSDLLGVLRFTEKTGLTPDLKFFLYDREQAWSESWSDVDDKVNTPISTYFQIFDVTEPGTWQQNSKYLTSDLFTMIYFASEIYRLRGAAEPFFRNLFDRAKPGALFLYVDNAFAVFFEWFDKQYAGASVTVVARNDGVQIGLPPEEEKRDLGAHYSRIAGQPKLTANVAYRVLRKD